MFSLHFVRYPTFNKFYFSPQDDDMIAWKLTPLPYQMRNTIRDYGIGNVASYWVSSWDRLRSKRFRLVSEQRNTEEGDFRFWPREKWNESQKWKRGEGEGKGKEGNACRQPPRFWKPAFASERSAWLARLVEQCWHVSIKGLFHTERSCLVRDTRIKFLWLLFILVGKICPPMQEYFL